MLKLLLFLFNFYLSAFCMYEEPLNTNIQNIIKRLIKKQSITSYQNAAYPINKEISEKIIKEIEWNQDNIHLLLLLDENCDNFGDALTEDNIKLLKNRLIKETNIMSFENAEFTINKKISEKIIQAMKWNKYNIHLLLLLDEYCHNFEDALIEKNIELLKNRLIEQTDIMSFGNRKQLIPAIVSDEIIKKIKWNQYNIHLLLLLNDDCNNFRNALTEENIRLLKNRLIEQTDIMSYQNASQYINITISGKIMETIEWNKDNIHLLLLLYYPTRGYTDTLTEKNIELLKNRLIEQTDIMSFGNGKQLIPEIVSVKIIGAMQTTWNAENIHLLLLLDENCDNFGDALTEKNIDLLKNRLIKETNIMSYQNVSRYINITISGKIMKTIEWNKDNIHLLLLLDPKAEGYTDALTEENIELLIIRLIEETDIMSYRNGKYFIPQIVSEKIIETIEWNKDNIHLLLLLNRNCDNFENALTEKNIDLLIIRLIEETNIMSFENVEFTINKKISKKIIKAIKWDENNIHLLLLLDKDCNNFEDALTEDNIKLLKKRLIKETNIMSYQNVKYPINKKVFEAIMEAM